MPDYANINSFIPFSYITSLKYHKDLATYQGFKPGKSILDLFRNQEQATPANINNSRITYESYVGGIGGGSSCIPISLPCGSGEFVDLSDACVNLGPGGSPSSISNSICSAAHAVCAGNPDPSCTDIAQDICTCVNPFINLFCCQCVEGDWINNDNCSAACDPADEPECSIHKSMSLAICDIKRSLQGTFGTPGTCDINCDNVCDCPNSVCFNENFIEQCACGGGCHCDPGCVEEGVCPIPIWCPCLQHMIWSDEVCPAYCCDPSIAGCIECCPPGEEGCGIYVPASQCCPTCAPCESAGGATIPDELCEQFTCAMCAINPALPICVACKPCLDGGWVPIGNPCSVSNCNQCTTDPCPGCVFCPITGSWIPSFAICQEGDGGGGGGCVDPLNPNCSEGDPGTMCYSYSQNDPIYYNPNPLHPSVTLLYENVTTSTASFSYGSIATLCEIPDEFQLCVFVTRVWELGAEPTEIQLTFELNTVNPLGLSAGFTLNTTAATLTLNSPLLPGEVLNIRRCSESNKMLFHFTDGAKLSAQDLNASLHQLLFLIQEKEFATKAVTNNYPLPNIAIQWGVETEYSAGDFVTYQVPNPDPQTAPPTFNSTIVYKSLVPVMGTPTPDISEDWEQVAWLSNGFVLEGGQDLSGPVIFSLHGVDIGDALVWNGTKFIGARLNLGSINDLGDVNVTNPASDEVLTWDTATDRWINLPIRFPDTVMPSLDVVDLSLQDWAFYKPQSTQANINAAYDGDTLWEGWGVPLTAFRDGDNWVIPNPPTVINIVSKMFPNLDPVGFFEDVTSLLSQTNAQSLSPIISRLSWDLMKGISSTSHLSTTFWSSPEELYSESGPSFADTYAKTVVNTGADGAFRSVTLAGVVSKIFGYGLRNEDSNKQGFFLNIPESRVTTFNTPAYDVDGAIKITPLASVNDIYLENIRDLAFALDGADQATPTPDESRRINRSQQIQPIYTQDAVQSWKRLDNNDALTAGITLKMPKEIVYYNQMAAILGADKDDNAVFHLPTVFSEGTYRPKNYNPGYMPTPYQIQWFLANVQQTFPTTPNQFPISPLNRSLWPTQVTAPAWSYPGPGGTIYKPDLVDEFDHTEIPTHDDVIGDIALLVDANRLFSTASNYLAEPRDTYVFNVALSAAASTAIYQIASTSEPERAQVVLEWGLHDVNKKEGEYSSTLCKALGMLKREDIRVFTSPLIRETVSSSHLKLFIEVPRMKYIGYSNFFRRSGNNVVTANSTTLALWYATHFNSDDVSDGSLPSIDTSPAEGDLDKIIGLRNEVAVKFVRLGIPTNLWINLSVLVTKTQLSLL